MENVCLSSPEQSSPLEGSLVSPLSTRFFDSVLTVPFSAFLTCHSMTPLRMTNGAVPRAVILSGQKGKCVPTSPEQLSPEPKDLLLSLCLQDSSTQFSPFRFPHFSPVIP